MAEAESTAISESYLQLVFDHDSKIINLKIIKTESRRHKKSVKVYSLLPMVNRIVKLKLNYKII